VRFLRHSFVAPGERVVVEFAGFGAAEVVFEA
jgi:hypothetical protein